MRKKNISTDELISILDTLPKTRKSNTLSAKEVENYIKYYNITSGEYFVPAFVIYEHYLNWCHTNTPFNKKIFFKHFSTYFEKKLEFMYSFYKINLESIGLTYEQYEQIILEVKDAQKEVYGKNNRKYKESKKNKTKPT
jgi:hypothetical protein